MGMEEILDNDFLRKVLNYWQFMLLIGITGDAEILLHTLYKATQ